jgi:hypothetical protein
MSDVYFHYSSFLSVVEKTGIEPATSAVQGQRSPS